MGQCRSRWSSQPPSSSQRSASGEGSRALYSKPSGGSAWKRSSARRHGAVSAPRVPPSHRSGAGCSGKGPVEEPSRTIPSSCEPAQVTTPVTGWASSGTWSTSTARNSMPVGGSISSFGSATAPSSSSSSSGRIQYIQNRHDTCFSSTSGSEGPYWALKSPELLGNKHGGTPSTLPCSSPHPLIRFLNGCGSRKRPTSSSTELATNPSIVTDAPANPFPQQRVRSTRRVGGGGGRGLKLPTTTGHIANLDSSHPPSSWQRSNSGDGFRSWYSKPAGGIMLNSSSDTTHCRAAASPFSSSSSDSLSSLVPCSPCNSYGPMDCPARVSSFPSDPGHTTDPSTGWASSGICTLSAARKSWPSSSSSASVSSIPTSQL
mmetsp:Transcript_59332/g.167130  ORF Transcript_59332/g.167130 Transcript_59332/m.167130 type:complete len:374 (-) Transcript_59332:516-1637(-)